jgi:hypothetical protein
MERNIRLEISQLLGEPIDINLKAPIAVDLICNIDTAKPGDDVYKYDSVDTDADEIKTLGSDGVITATKVNLKGKTPLTFVGLNSDKYYILLDEILASPDQSAFVQKRAKIVRGMDKTEVRRVLNLILDDTDVVEVEPESLEDIYDVIVRAKHLLEDYGNAYVLLEGSSVKETIDVYSKKKADEHNYDVDLKRFLREAGIQEQKIFGTVKNTGDSTGVALLNAAKFILVARDSTIANGKPLWFVRRIINPEIAKMMKAEVDNVQRAIFVAEAPTQVEDTEVMGYGVFGYESIVAANMNYKAEVKSADLTDILL